MPESDERTEEKEDDGREHQDFYLDLIQQIIDEMRRFSGEQVALKYARKAPLDIAADGTVEGYYGEGINAVTTLLERYDDYMGEHYTNTRIRRVTDDLPPDKQDLLPERLQPSASTENHYGILERLKRAFYG